jgi:hypothetical protein
MQSYEEAMAEAVSLGLMTEAGHATDRCQCPTCEDVFSTEGNFGRHLAKGRNRDDHDGPWCRPPGTVGLIQHERGWWHLPGAEDAYEGRFAPSVERGSRRSGGNGSRLQEAVS